MTKLLRNLYWETVIDNLLEQEKIKLKFKSKSELLRKILKERYGLCLNDDCSAISINDFCQRHYKNK
ncbi:hypothetical protein J4230_02635 [Candidatus Woesearchaeota archaeon]|nr:hypothetical protein [Candidatus Woesearchaeota archaeon]